MDYIYNVIIISAPKSLKAVWVTAKRVMDHGPSNSSLYLSLWSLFWRLRTETGGLTPSSHQLTALSHQLKSV